jgi:EAL domain-containing protein (putative c-di-GMP-specific phosphodiesterase class I)
MDAIVREVAAAPIDHSKLVIEVTETAAIVNVERARSFAHRLATLGCQFALDDFGAGFGSFYYLKHLPFDALKIDGDFIRHLPSSPADQLTVKAIVDIARGMGKRTIAEFVEDEETLALLHELGVDYAQGYHVGRPEPLPDELRAILAAGSGPRPEPRPDTAAR